LVSIHSVIGTTHAGDAKALLGKEQFFEAVAPLDQNMIRFDRMEQGITWNPIAN
jgi:hypothetical protein